jgi:glycosyltransferase involved in cell wall biosynthesis
MDLILLVDDQDITENSPKLISKAGLEKIESICTKLVNGNNIAINIYVQMRSARHNAQKAIDDFTSWSYVRSVNMFFVISVEDLYPEIIAYINFRGFRNLVITCDNDEEKLAGAGKMISSFNALYPESKINISIWPESNKKLYTHRRFLELKSLNINIAEPLFGPAKAGRSPLPENIAAQFKSSSPCCEIANKTIVINSKGELMMCPSGVKGMDVGVNLFESSYEQLLMYKGMCAVLAGKTNTCINCDYKGRFQWEKKAGAQVEELINIGKSMGGAAPWNVFKMENIPQCNVQELGISEQEVYLEQFRLRLIKWAAHDAQLPDPESNLPSVSIETPVFKGAWLIPCIESVLYQTSNRWVYYLLWDGGDALSRRILDIVQDLDHPKLKVFFFPNQGIARSRNALSNAAVEDYIIPLDDDDMLGATIVEDLSSEAIIKPWASIIRAKRRYIDENGALVDMDEWFPFEHRNYQHGMVTDLHNHCQPTLFSRKAYAATSGWEGFPDFYYAGEDCDIYLKLEEKGAIELYDKVLYYYRLNSKRTSHLLKPEGAYEMWRRLADKTIDRIGLPLQRVNAQPPFIYEQKPAPVFTKDMIDFVIAFYEADEKELYYAQRRPVSGQTPQYFELTGYNSFVQKFPAELVPFSRIELSFSCEQHVEGALQIQITESDTGEIVATGKAEWKGKQEISKALSIPVGWVAESGGQNLNLSLTFMPARHNSATIKVLFYELNEPILFARIFSFEKGYSKRILNRCIQSLRKIGIKNEAIHVIDEKRSSSVNRNKGFSLTKQPLVCFIDDDAEITSQESLDTMLAVMAEHDAGLIGPRLITEDQKIFCADPFFNEKQRPVPRGIGESDDGRYQYISEVTWLPSTFLIVKREVMIAINGFDEMYEGSQMEDVDLCLKARYRDFKCVYAGNASVLHYNNQRNDRFAENYQRFVQRWGNHKNLFKQINSAN